MLSRVRLWRQFLVYELRPINSLWKLFTKTYVYRRGPKFVNVKQNIDRLQKLSSDSVSGEIPRYVW